VPTYPATLHYSRPCGHCRRGKLQLHKQQCRPGGPTRNSPDREVGVSDRTTLQRPGGPAQTRAASRCRSSGPRPLVVRDQPRPYGRGYSRPALRACVWIPAMTLGAPGCCLQPGSRGGIGPRQAPSIQCIGTPTVPASGWLGQSNAVPQRTAHAACRVTKNEERPGARDSSIRGLVRDTGAPPMPGIRPRGSKPCGCLLPSQVARSNLGHPAGGDTV
jgi:hypothetical protein